jgi:hypothetical protein
VTVVNRGAAAGTAYKDLSFLNHSGATCTLQGYPGVSFVDAQGQQIGPPAQRVVGTEAAIVLAPGATATAEITYHDAYVATFPACQPATATGVRVYPPNQKAAVTVPVTLVVCANVTAIGTAGVAPVTK